MQAQSNVYCNANGHFTLFQMIRVLIFVAISFSSCLAFATNSFTVKFKVDATALPQAAGLGIRGSLAPLSWEKTWLLQDLDKDGMYEGEITFSDQVEVLEYKYVYGDKKLVWELEAENRLLLLNGEQLAFTDVWNKQRNFDIAKLPKLSPEKLNEDFKIFRQAMLDVHPGLYKYNTRTQVDSLFNLLQASFTKPITYQEAFLHFTRFTSAIQCGHTFPSFYNQTGFIQQVVLNQKDKLPFAFRILDKKMIITSGVAETADVPLGTEIIAIDEIPAQNILSETAKLVKADGANDGKRYADLNTFGVGGYFEMFDCYFPLLHPPREGHYTVEIKRPGKEQPEKIQVRTVSRAERTNALIKKNPDHITRADQLWKLEFWDNQTAYLQLGTFDAFQLSFEWSKFLQNAFKEIKKRNTSHLVIDIRWNEGGQDEILLFLGKNITQKPIKIPQRQDLVRYSTIAPALKPYLFTWDNTFFDLSAKTKPFNTEYRQFMGENLAEIKPFKQAYGGKTYLLINGANSSATFYFAEIARQNQLATLIGETTGGSQKGLNAGTMFFLRLPNSKIEIDIPILGTFSDEKPQGGIEPDVEVRQTLSDLLLGEDTVLKATKAMINK